MDQKKGMLLFCGNPGLGKTYFCAALVEWIFMNFRFCRYYTEKSLQEKLRHFIQEESGDYMRHLHYLIDDDVIILDDVGSQKSNEWRDDVFFSFLDQRYNLQTPTILTSNLSVEEFKKRYHPRINSRIFASENTIIEIMNGPDLRQQGL